MFLTYYWDIISMNQIFFILWLAEEQTLFLLKSTHWLKIFKLSQEYFPGSALPSSLALDWNLRQIGQGLMSYDPNPPPSCNVVFTRHKSKPNNFSDSTSLPWNREIETVKRFTKLKIKSITLQSVVNSPLKPGFIFSEVFTNVLNLFHQTLKSSITPFYSDTEN